MDFKMTFKSTIAAIAGLEEQIRNPSNFVISDVIRLESFRDALMAELGGMPEAAGCDVRKAIEQARAEFRKE